MCRSQVDTVDVLVKVPARLSCSGRDEWKIKAIDLCIADLIRELNSKGYPTVACCCGHGEYPGSIVFADGQELTIAQSKNLLSDR